MMNSECKKYYRNIKRLLPDALNNRKLYLARNREMLKTYENEHEEFSYDDLIYDLGYPKDIADRLLLMADADSRRKSMTNKKIIFCSIIGAALILLGLLIFDVSDKEANAVYLESESEVYAQNGK